MILEKLFLNNFGVFRGEHVLELTPESSKAPIILVGGLNGGGKTTILDAVQLVFFGKLAKCSTRGTQSYEEFLRNCITRGEDSKDGAHIQLNFSYYFDGKRVEYVIVRSWREGRKRINESFQVYRDGVEDEGLTENWLDQVDQFLPVGLAELFFFDGEKIARLAESDNAAKMLSTAINTLLGIDLVDKLEKDLATYEKDIRDSGKTDSDDGVVASLEREADTLTKQFHELAQKRGRMKVEHERLNGKLEIKEQEFREQGGELIAQRKELEASAKELANQIKRIEIDMRLIVSAEAPLAIVEKDLKRIKEQVRVEEDSKKQTLLLEELEKRDRNILQKIKGDEITKIARSTLESLFQADIETRRHSADIPLVLNLSEGTANAVFSVTESFFKSTKRGIKSLLDDHARSSDRLNRIKERLELVPDEAAISDQGKALADLRTQAIRKEAEVEATSEQIDELSKEQDSCETRLRKELERRLSTHTESTTLQRKLLYAARTRETMRKFRTVVLLRKIKQIEQEILGCFQQLLRKKSLVANVIIDPETYQMELKGHQLGEVIPTDRLSAGERQLLAISTLWGLARVSGRPLPNIIDTPLGRLDSKHRANLIENYFPNASHQVIILSTDEEITPSSFEKLKRRVGKSYELYYSDETASTEIRDGYFFK